jgi:hypothetical protein
MKQLAKVCQKLGRIRVCIHWRDGRGEGDYKHSHAIEAKLRIEGRENPPLKMTAGLIWKVRQD